MNRITILLAEDHTIVREAFRNMLEREDSFEVVGEVQDGRQAVGRGCFRRISGITMRAR